MAVTAATAVPGYKCAFSSQDSWPCEADDDLRISGYRINEPKLRPRLAAIFDVEEEKLKCIWINGTYVVKGVPREKEIGQVGDFHT